MKKLASNQFKTETGKELNKGARLTLDQFKKQTSTEKNEELEKLTGGVLAACHPSWTNGGILDWLPK
ncbi:hypothetical protein EIB75_05515 [Epilithonimonas vandammei]|uniref:Uncharacterized protein n=1 Tax=Epilithonimonas vandammei TaxID=2487072 RepID=A0A3G8ZCI3_9FLAO|nr:hypothetical protein [Epilithonimonas vandammei]AZI54740.1 hypothetical protein EIB75_05515 [Epilithonimonas vandammei]